MRARRRVNGRVVFCGLPSWQTVGNPPITDPAVRQYAVLARRKLAELARQRDGEIRFCTGRVLLFHDATPAAKLPVPFFAHGLCVLNFDEPRPRGRGRRGPPFHGRADVWADVYRPLVHDVDRMGARWEHAYVRPRKVTVWLCGYAAAIYYGRFRRERARALLKLLTSRDDFHEFVDARRDDLRPIHELPEEVREFAERSLAGARATEAQRKAWDADPPRTLTADESRAHYEDMKRRRMLPKARRRRARRVAPAWRRR